MATPAIEKTTPRPLRLRLDPRLVEDQSDFSVALKLALSNVAVTVAVVYRFDPEVRAYTVAVWHSDIPMPGRAVSLELAAPETDYLRQLHLPVECAAGDPLFSSFPETLHCGLMRMLIVPLAVKDNTLGYLTLGRTEDKAFVGTQLEEVLVGARLLKVVFERNDLERNLAARKLIERAKGILQRTRRINEEQAYVTLRNISRGRQRAMADVARDIISGDARLRSRAS